MGNHIHGRQEVHDIQKIWRLIEEISQEVHKPKPVGNRPGKTITTKTKMCQNLRVHHKSTDPSPLVANWQPRSKNLYI